MKSVGSNLQSFLGFELLLQNSIFKSQAINPNTHGFNFLETEMISNPREKSTQGQILLSCGTPKHVQRDSKASQLPAPH
jgi:hypothetical protein